MEVTKSNHAARYGILFGVAIFTCMLVWSQLVPLGAGPDEPSNFVKSAAIIRGEFVGKDLDRWLVTVDGWAFDRNSGVRRVILTVDGQISAFEEPDQAREDVALFLEIDAETLVGFSLSSTLPNNDPRSYAVYVELNDGTIVILPVADGDNVVKSPEPSTLVNGRLPEESRSTSGYVDESRVTANLGLSYWTTEIDIDPQFNAAHQVPWCFAPYGERPACNTPIEDQQITDGFAWTNMGRYPPAGFAVSGIGTLVGPNDFAFRLSRAMTAVASAAMLALAFVCLKRRSLSALPMLIAVTPGVIFISSVVSPSGLEICAAIALWVSLPGLLSAFDASRIETVTVALAGVFLIVTRPLGPVLYAALAAIVVISSGQVRHLVGHVRRHYVVYGLHATAVVFMIWWYVFIFNSVVDPDMTAGLPKMSLGEQLLHAIGDIPRVIDESIGNYGWLDTATPRPIALIIFVTTVTLVVVGWRSLTRSAKRAIPLLGVGCVMLIIAEDLNYYEILRGFGVQGRHLTPLLVGIPIIGARYIRISDRSKWLAVSIWSGVFICSGLAALRRYSVGIIGDNALDMFSNPVWSPPLGINWSIFCLVASSAFVGIVVMKTETQL